MAKTKNPIPLSPGQELELPRGDKITSKVKISAPQQEDGEIVSYTIEDPPATTLPDPTGFSPGRIIANIRLSKNGKIKPPIRLNIEIIQADVQRAGGKKFKLGYHDGTRWQVLKGDIASKVSAVEIELSKVGDPPIGISP